MNGLRIILCILIAFCLVAAVFSGFSLAIGYALAWLIPPLDTGTAILVGAVVTLGTIDLFGRLLSLAPFRVISTEGKEEAEEEWDFAGQVAATPPHQRRWTKAKSKKRR